MDALTRRRFLKDAGLVSLGAAVTLGNATSRVRGTEAAKKTQVPLLPNAAELPSGGRPIKLFCCDLNGIVTKDSHPTTIPAMPQDWAYLDPEEYFAWHRDFGINIFFLQGYAWGGYAFYPTQLGLVAPGPGKDLFPKIFRMAGKAGLPFCGYFSIGIDPFVSNMRKEWVVPTSRNYYPKGVGLLAPESPWTDLLCSRVTEFLRSYPVEWINFDCFNYGKVNSMISQFSPHLMSKGRSRRSSAGTCPRQLPKLRRKKA